MVTDIAQLILRKNKVVAGINIAIVLHHSRMTAFLGISTDAGRNTHPVCQRAVENLNEDFAHILPYPLIENCTEKVAPLLRRNRCLAQRNLILVGKTCQGTAILMSGQSLNDRCELQKLTAVFLEEAVELQRMIGIIGIHHRHRIPFYPVFLQQFDALHHLLPRWFSRSRQPVMVMIRLRTIDRDAYQPMVLGEKLAPFIGQQRAVGLNYVVDAPASSILLL